MRLDKLIVEHNLANARLSATKNKLENAQTSQHEHNKMMLEYSVKARDFSAELKVAELKVQRIGQEVRTLKVQLDTDKEIQQVQELKETQPTFWEVTANCLDEAIAGSSEVKLTFAPVQKASDMMKELKQLTDTTRGFGDESALVFEAQKQFNEVMTKVCLDEIKGRGYSEHRSKQLTYPILQLLNNPRIKSQIQNS